MTILAAFSRLAEVRSFRNDLANLVDGSNGDGVAITKELCYAHIMAIDNSYEKISALGIYVSLILYLENKFN